jgi:hypothetical protein
MFCRSNYNITNFTSYIRIDTFLNEFSQIFTTEENIANSIYGSQQGVHNKFTTLDDGIFSIEIVKCQVKWRIYIRSATDIKIKFG